MKVLKRIEKLLDMREKLAGRLLTVNAELDDWLQRNGADLNDGEIADSVMSGVLIYCEPAVARMAVEKYITDKMQFEEVKG